MKMNKKINGSSINIEYVFDFSKTPSRVELTNGLVIIKVGDSHLFEYTTRASLQREDRSSLGYHTAPYKFIYWFSHCLASHLSYSDCPQGDYLSGIDVYQKYRNQCLFPANMLPRENPKEAKPCVPEAPDVSEHECGAVVYISDEVDPFDRWMNHHLISHAAGDPRDVCIQRWPNTKDFIEISWEFENRVLINRSGRVFVPVGEYLKSVVNSAQEAFQMLREKLSIKSEEEEQIRDLEKILRAYRTDMGNI